VQQHLELESLLALVADVQHGLQSIFAQSHAVDEAELVRPGLPVLFRKVRRAETEVELDRVVAALGESARLRRRAAKVLPCGVTSEAVLRKGASRVVLRRRAKSLTKRISIPVQLLSIPLMSSLLATYREDDGNTSANGLAAVQGGSIAHEEVLPAVALPAEHASTKEQDFNRIACRQGCVNTALLDVNGRLRATCAGRDGAGLVGTVHCGCGMSFVRG
jgi:hypothetical protein